MAPSVSLNAPAGHALPRALLSRAVELVLQREGVEEAEFSVTFLPDPEILELNRRWLGHDWVPDVLSFALHEEGGPPVGDVYVGIEQAVRQAREHGVTVDEELARLAVHGTLHVLGWDHSEKGSGAMYRRQEALLEMLMGEYGRTEA